jgi:hypothetical protein
MTSYELYERCNETELYQIARSAGLPVTPSATKDQLIKYILGEEFPQLTSNEFDEWRLAIMGFVIEHRKTLEVQLRCPAKSMDPRACFQCVDQQVVSCLVENRNNLNLIQLHRKPIEPITGETMTATVMNAENAPRDKAKLVAAGSFQLRKIAESLGLLEDQEAKLGFGKLLPDERADFILTKLIDWDAGKGKAGAPANGTPAPAAQAPAPTAETPGASVAAVDPASFQAAQAATAGPGVAGTQRKPKVAAANGAGPAPEGDVGAIVATMDALTKAVQGQGTAVSAALGELKTAVTGLTSNVDAKIGGIQTAIVAAMNQQTELLKVTLLVVMTLAEERGIQGQDALSTAIGDISTLDALLKQIKGASGKAA